MNNNLLSGAMWNQVEDDIVETVKRYEDWLVEDLVADGYPPFGEPSNPRDVYERLVAWRASGDPAFFDDPRALSDLERLSLQFGPPPAPATAPFVAPSMGGLNG